MGNTSTRYGLYKEQKGKCHYCQVHMHMGDTTSFILKATACTIDHVVPKAKGGRNTRSNYVGACLLCNNLRGSRPYGPFRWFVSKYGNKQTPEEVVRYITREQYDAEILMWAPLLGYYVPLPEKEPEIIIPKWKERRRILVEVRDTLKGTVSAFDIFDINAMWGKHLKQERSGGKSAPLDIQ